MKRKIFFGILYFVEIILAILDIYMIGHLTLGVLLLFLIGIIIFATTKLNGFVYNWETAKYKCDAELSYKEFKNLYDIMPEQFELKNDYVFYGFDVKLVDVKLVNFITFLDYCQYKKFFAQYKKRIIKMKRQDRQKAFFDQVQHDLENKRKKE